MFGSKHRGVLPHCGRAHLSLLVLQAEKVLADNQMPDWGKVYPGLWSWNCDQAFVTGFACKYDKSAGDKMYLDSFRMTDEPATALHESVLLGSFWPPLKRGRKAQESMERVTVPCVSQERKTAAVRLKKRSGQFLIARSSPASPRKTLSFLTLLLRFTFYF